MTRSPLFFALFALPALAAPKPKPLHEFQCTMPPHGFSEVDLQAEAGGSAVATWEAGGPLEWNVHVHEKGVTSYLQKGKAKRAALKHAVKDAGKFSFMWENPAEKPVSFKVTVTGDKVQLASYASCYEGTPRK